MYFIGADAGGTKTAFVLSDAEGRIYARHHSGGGSFFDKGADGIYRLVQEGVAILCQKAGITKEAVAFAGFGFPGYGERKGSEQAIIAACEKAFLSGRVVCECDCYLGWAGSFGLSPGINIIAGTGSICFGVDAFGRSGRSSGWGAYCDEGSCRWLGSRLIQLYTKQADGRIPRTALYNHFRSHMQLENDMDFVYPLNHLYGSDAVKTAALQRLLIELYEMGEPTAAAVYREAAGELALAALAVARKLDMDTAYKVSYSGGLFQAGLCITEPLREAVEKNGGQLCEPRFSPELGALLMAMRQVMPEKDFSSFAFFE